MGRTNRYVIAYTANTLILVDRETEKSSEIPWESGGNEKFYLDNENVCMIINAGEISFIEYGKNEIAGDVDVVLRDNNRTEVIVQEANAKVAYELDSAMIEFETAIDDLDLARAVVFLEESERENVDVSAMWRQLAQIALEQGQLIIAQRAFAGLKDISRVK
uniref:Uncharacterized protein n=1 Tax=Panagrolaimus sp. JU765 TaxID=591449 RepID=A0AC34RHS0_9BILA